MEQEYLTYKKTFAFIGIYDTSDQIIKVFYEALLNHLHWLCHYEEEDHIIKFDLAVSIDKSIENCNCSFIPLIELDISNDKNEMALIISKALKKTIALCNASTNVYLFLSKNNKLYAGVYSSELGKNANTDRSLLDEGFVLFKHFCETTILIQKENNTLSVNFAYDNKYSDNDLPPEFTTSLSCYWYDMFNRIRRSVHGTICLIVAPDWCSANDSNFNSSKIIELQNRLLDLNPDNYSPSETSTFENSFNIFVSMLNYDGITIIDTDGYVRAYNGICKLNSNGSGTNIGGARHQAYEQLKTSCTDTYKGIYFQSQEGEVKFYSFDKEVETTYFDSQVMVWSSKRYFEELEKVQQYVVPKHSDESLVTLLRKAYNLREIHYGFDNFYNEPAAAKEILEEIKNIKDKLNCDYFINNIAIFRKTINVLLLCYMGNMYGYSIDAQYYIKLALSYFIEYWEIYDDKKLYYDEGIISSIVDSPKTYYRLMDFFDDKPLRNFKELTENDFYEIRIGFRLLREKIEGQDSKD